MVPVFFSLFLCKKLVHKSEVTQPVHRLVAHIGAFQVLITDLDSFFTASQFQMILPQIAFAVTPE